MHREFTYGEPINEGYLVIWIVGLQKHQAVYPLLARHVYIYVLIRCGGIVGGAVPPEIW